MFEENTLAQFGSRRQIEGRLAVDVGEVGISAVGDEQGADLGTGLACGLVEGCVVPEVGCMDHTAEEMLLPLV